MHSQNSDSSNRFRSKNQQKSQQQNNYAAQHRHQVAEGIAFVENDQLTDTVGNQRQPDPENCLETEQDHSPNILRRADLDRSVKEQNANHTAQVPGDVDYNHLPKRRRKSLCRHLAAHQHRVRQQQCQHRKYQKVRRIGIKALSHTTSHA